MYNFHVHIYVYPSFPVIFYNRHAPSWWPQNSYKKTCIQNTKRNTPKTAIRSSFNICLKNSVTAAELSSVAQRVRLLATPCTAALQKQTEGQCDCTKPCHVKGGPGSHWPARGCCTASPCFPQRQGGRALKEPEADLTQNAAPCGKPAHRTRGKARQLGLRHPSARRACGAQG